MGGAVKAWSGQVCRVPGCEFELLLYTVGSPPRTFPLCPFCYNNPREDWLDEGALNVEDIDIGVTEDEAQPKRSCGWKWHQVDALCPRVPFTGRPPVHHRPRRGRGRGERGCIHLGSWFMWEELELRQHASSNHDQATTQRAEGHYLVRSSSLSSLRSCGSNR